MNKTKILTTLQNVNTGFTMFTGTKEIKKTNITDKTVISCVELLFKKRTERLKPNEIEETIFSYILI